jgi:ABC-type glutathione transport system ATPase component
MTGTDALVVENLNVVYEVGGRDRHVVSDLSFRIKRGEAYGLVGESGCGKSTAALAAIRYLARNRQGEQGPHPDRRARSHDPISRRTAGATQPQRSDGVSGSGPR